MRSSQTDKNKEIKLPNKLAHAKYAMNVSEQKLYLYAIRNIDQSAEGFPESRINLLDFAKYADLEETRLYKDINKMTTRLMQVIIYVPKDKNKWEKHNLTKNCKYNNGVITFQFNDDMKPLLLGLSKHYFKQAPEIMGFTSWYSFRLYDLFKSQAYKNEPLVVDISWLKTILGIEGKYEDYSNFRRRVIDPSVKEINQYSDIQVSYRKPKVGVPVTNMTFDIVNHKGVAEKEYAEMLQGMYDMEEFKSRIGLTPKIFTDIQIIELYEVSSEKFASADNMDDLYEYMRLNYIYTRERVKHGSPYSYFKKALQNDYAHAMSQIMTGYYI